MLSLKALRILSVAFLIVHATKKERERDQTMGQVVTYKRLNAMENYKTVSPKSGHGPLRVVQTYRALTRKILVLWIDGHSWEVVMQEGLTASGHNNSQHCWPTILGVVVSVCRS